jgi:hypothetical protein
MIVSPLIYILVTCLLGFILGIILSEIFYSFKGKSKPKGIKRRATDGETAKKWWFSSVVSFLRAEPRFLASKTCLAFGVLTFILIFGLTISVDVSILKLKELAFLLAPWPPTLIALAVYFKIKK